MVPLVYDYIITNSRGKAKHRVRFSPYLYEHKYAYTTCYDDCAGFRALVIISDFRNSFGK